MSGKTIRETAAALGVIASMVFVGMEIRLNTRSAEVSAYQHLMAQISELNTLMIENPEFAGLVARDAVWSRDPDTLNDSEYQQVGAYLWLLFRHGDMAYHQFERGVLSPTRLRSAMNPVTQHLGYPLVLEAWEERKAGFSVEYQTYVDGIIATIS
jgi:hypothetical protein